MSEPHLIEINGAAIPAAHCPPRATVVYPVPEEYTLTGLPIPAGYPTAILAWDEGAPAATIHWWAAQAGRVTGIVLPDLRYGAGVVRDSTLYEYHSAWGYGVILAPTGDEGARVESATLHAPTPSATLAELGGAIIVRIEQLGRYSTWPMP